MTEANSPKIQSLNQRKRVNLLGVGIDPVTSKTLEHLLRGYLHDGEQHFLATVNPEFIIEARANKNFADILSYSDLNVADGIGLLWASKYLQLPVNDYWVHNRAKKFTYRKLMACWQAFYSLAAIIFYPPYLKTSIPTKITGTRLIHNLVKLTQDGENSLYLLGGQKGIATAAKITLQKQYPKALIVGNRSGYLDSADPGRAGKIFLKAVNKAQPNILIVALGSPFQEEWIFKHMDKMPSVKIAVGVGGALDFIAKNKKRAPVWMRRHGLEWLFRFYLEPRRLPRIRNATFHFVTEVVRHKINSW